MIWTMAEQFDVIVVGAGPAGSAAALAAAQSGARVLLLERGAYPGAKNIVGGMIHTRVLDDLVPVYWKEAPLERAVKHQRLMFTSEGVATTLDVACDAFVEDPFNGYTVLRGRFDPWFAGKAQEAGAVLVCDTVVDDLLYEGDRVVGVKVRRDEGEIEGGVVILADGINSLLAQKAGLYAKPDPSCYSVGVKELLELPHDEINARFGLLGDDGVAYACIGDFGRDIPGGAFIYTNKDSVSIGVVCEPHALVEQKVTADEVLERFKAKPEVNRLIEGARLIEYSGHLIPEGGYDKMFPLSRNGLLIAGDAAGFGVNTGLVLMGMNLAIDSGKIAGRVAAEAARTGDTSKTTMGSRYEKTLMESVSLSEMKKHRKAPDLISSPRMYGAYPDIINGLLQDMLAIGDGVRPDMKQMFKSALKNSGVGLKDLLRDGLTGMRAV